jgi:hypothetical protein
MRTLFMAFAGQMLNFLFPSPSSVADGRLRPARADDVGHRQAHMHVEILFSDEPAKLLNRSSPVDLVSSFHSDSRVVLAERYAKAVTPSGGRASVFCGLTGIFSPAPNVVWRG